MRRDETLTQNQMINDINTALGLTNKGGIISKNQDTDIKKSIKTFTDKDAKNCSMEILFLLHQYQMHIWVNTFIIREFTSTKQKDHLIIFIKCFFNEKGKNNEKKYLDILYKTIRYRNDNWTLNKDNYLKELKEFCPQTE